MLSMADLIIAGVGIGEGEQGWNQGNPGSREMKGKKQTTAKLY